MNREKITLTREQETLLIPLYAKAQPNPILEDRKAQEILAAVSYDFERLQVPMKTAVTLRMRAKQMDAYTQDFLIHNRGGLVLHLGCGLDSRCERVARRDALWYDLDFPEVIELRRKFYPETDDYHLIPSSVTEHGWMRQVLTEGRPVFIAAEGLLMYLSEDEVRALILGLQQRFPGARMVFDAFSQLTAERVQAHPSLAKTGAVVRWGIDDPQTMESWDPAGKIKLVEEWFFDQSKDVARLGIAYRAMFGLAGLIPAARKAQRLVVLQL